MKHVWRQFFELKKLNRRLVQADKNKSSSQRRWVSTDRGVIAALLSTTLRPVHKSSTDDLGPPLCQVGDQDSCAHLQYTTKYFGSGWSQKTIRPRAKRRSDSIVAMTRQDSALEAFRHNPTDLASHHQPIGWVRIPNVWTCGSSRTEQDYYRNDENQ